MDDREWHDAIDRRVEQARRDYQGPHCCLTMDAELAKKGAILCYSQRYREYGIKIPQSTGYMIMDYCLSCGKKLPFSVRDEWFDILEKEYGLESPMEEDKKKVPQEFWTEEWWKTRGL
jgi:hypothetical protein